VRERLIELGSWERYIGHRENNVHGRRNGGYKTLKKLNKSEMDALSLNPLLTPLFTGCPIPDSYLKYA
jgi:hypothetical protein